jgi:hypothetical protein
MYKASIITSTKEIVNTTLVPNFSFTYPPIGGPMVKDNPSVARARPYAGALLWALTQSAI